jgi:hypothetical protein
MNKLKITTGLWIIEPDNNWECAVNIGEEGKECTHFINLTNNDIEGWEEMHANAMLIADAGNTYQQCGLLPSELLKQRDKMIEVLNELQTYIRLIGVNKSLPIRLIYKKITELTDSIEKQEAEQ